MDERWTMDRAGRVRDAGSAAAQLKGLAAGMSRVREAGSAAAGRRKAPASVRATERDSGL